VRMELGFVFQVKSSSFKVVTANTVTADIFSAS